MKIRSIALRLLFLMMATSTFGQQQDEVAIRQLVGKYAVAVEMQDSVFLNQLFADDMTVVGGNGHLRDKKAEMKDLIGPYGIIFFHAKDSVIHVYPRSAIVVGKLNWKMKNNDREVTLTRRFTFTFAQVENRWKIVAQHIGMIR